MARKSKQPEPQAASTAAQLIEESLKLEDWIKAETKRFGDFLKPYKDRTEAIDNQLLALLNQQGSDSIKCDAGTAYISRLLNVKLDPEAAPYADDEGEHKGREAYLYFALDNPETMGLDAINIQPVKDSVKKYIEENGGQPPPGVSIGWFNRVNIRRS